jgi:hypothetical protein
VEEGRSGGRSSGRSGGVPAGAAEGGKPGSSSSSEIVREAVPAVVHKFYAPGAHPCCFRTGAFFDEKNERRRKRTIPRPVHAFLFGKPDSIKYGGYNLSFLQI